MLNQDVDNWLVVLCAVNTKDTHKSQSVYTAAAELNHWITYSNVVYYWQCKLKKTFMKWKKNLNNAPFEWFPKSLSVIVNIKDKTKRLSLMAEGAHLKLIMSHGSLWWLPLWFEVEEKTGDMSLWWMTVSGEEETLEPPAHHCRTSGVKQLNHPEPLTHSLSTTQYIISL